MSLDAERGLLYVPVGTPSNDLYGGNRVGEGLFGETDPLPRRGHRDSASGTTSSCTTASGTTTRRRRPNLVTITPDGKRVDAVVQLTKQGFAFVFDRVTGRPVWPIEERPGGEERRAGRSRVADAAVSHQAARVHRAGRDPG